MRERIGAAILAVGALAGCDQMEKIRAHKVWQARADELLQVQRDCNAKHVELQKALEVETWGRDGDYQLQREGREVRLWRALADGARDKSGRLLGRYCVLNPDPLQPSRCDAQQIKIGRILLDIEANDARFMAATNELMASIKSLQARE